MHDIDAQISRISGQQNYMESLQKITGNIFTIDDTIFREKHNKMCACDFNIKLLLERLSKSQPNETINTIQQEYLRESNAIDIKNKTFTMKQRKNKPPREIIDDMHKPPELIKTPWFKLVKRIEKTINKVFSEMFPKEFKEEQRTFEYISQDNAKHPELVDLRTVFDVKITDEQTYKSFTQLAKCSRIIINIMLMPMYDVKATIEKHWPKIDKIFKTKAFQNLPQTPDGRAISPGDIIYMLTQFIVAKYRATITGNNKHYVKLFLNTIGDENISSLDGARFMEIMDSIDLDKLNKNDNVYKFAMGAKTAMKKMINNENFNAEEIIRELDNMFNGDLNDTTPAPDTPEANTGDKYTDIL